ncbi:MAG: GNAT family N-acetyltransferase [Rhodospirillaceae bacterium]|nr:GNAT family N-acetyltransferase [Rhodospirillaceae bacterium]
MQIDHDRLIVAEYDPASMRDVLCRSLDAWGCNDPQSSYHAFWRSVLEDHSKNLDAFVLAIQDERMVGSAFSNWRPFSSATCRSVVFSVDEDCRRQGVGTALHQEITAAFRRQNLTRQSVLVMPEHHHIIPFLDACGFTEIEKKRSFRFAWNGKPYTYHQVPGITLYRFDRDHLDRKVGEELAAFYNQAYANEGICITFTGDHIIKLVVVDNTWMLYARDDASGRIVAYAEGTQSPLFSGVAVLRPWWGTGLAEWISGYAIDLYREMAFDSLWSLVRSRNAASLRLHERMGWHEDGSCLNYAFDIPI